MIPKPWYKNWKRWLAIVGITIITLAACYPLVYLPWIEKKGEEERIKSLMEYAGFTEEEAKEFDRIFKNYAPYNQTLLDFAKSLKAYPLTTSEIFRLTKSFPITVNSLKNAEPIISEIVKGDQKGRDFILKYLPLILDDGINATDASLMFYDFRMPKLSSYVIGNVKDQPGRITTLGLLYPNIQNLTLTEDRALDFVKKYSILLPLNRSSLILAKHWPKARELVELLIDKYPVEIAKSSILLLYPNIKNNTITERTSIDFINAYSELVKDGINQANLPYVKFYHLYPTLTDSLIKNVPDLGIPILFNLNPFIANKTFTENKAAYFINLYSNLTRNFGLHKEFPRLVYLFTQIPKSVDSGIKTIEYFDFLLNTLNSILRYVDETKKNEERISFFMERYPWLIKEFNWDEGNRKIFEFSEQYPTLTDTLLRFDIKRDYVLSTIHNVGPYLKEIPEFTISDFIKGYKHLVLDDGLNATDVRLLPYYHKYRLLTDTAIKELKDLDSILFVLDNYHPYIEAKEISSLRLRSYILDDADLFRVKEYVHPLVDPDEDFVNNITEMKLGWDIFFGIGNLSWIPTNITNSKVYEGNVYIRAKSVRGISPSKLYWVPISYTQFPLIFQLRAFPDETIRDFDLIPVNENLIESTILIKDFKGGREYEIVAYISDKKGSIKREIKTPYIREFENFGKLLYEKGIVISASYMPWNFAYVPMPPSGDTPLLGRYDTYDDIVQWKHVDWAQGHGVNVFYVDGGLWEPFKYRERRILRGLMDKGMKAAILWGGHWKNVFKMGGKGLPEWAVDLSNPYNFDRFLNLMRDLLSSDVFLHSNYHRVNGKLAVFMWDENALVNRNEAYAEWRKLSKQITGQDLFIIADCLPRIPRTNIEEYTSFWDKLKGDNWWKYVDALTSWIGFYEPSLEAELSSEERIEYYLQYYEQSLKTWKNFSEERGRYFVPTVTPGFDNSYSWGGPQIPLPRSVERFIKALDLAMEYSSEGYREIRIDTWNDWGEWSYIEPSLIEGFDYLNSLLTFLHAPPFYKLRLYITTTSDWSWVRLISGAKVVSSGIVEMKGGFPRSGGIRAVGLTQCIGAAFRGEKVSVTFDLALTDLSEEVEFEITRGDLGETVVEVWNINRAPLRVKTVHWSGLSEPSGQNAFKFTVNSDSIKSGGPLTLGLWKMTDTGFFLSRRLDNELPEFHPRFYRVRVAFTTTSDWASLSILRGAETLGVRLLDITGNPTRVKVNQIEFFLEQPLEHANTGSKIGLTADMILSNVVSDGFIEFVISKGHLNEATVEIFNYNTAPPVLIKQVTHSGVSSFEDPRNALTFTIDVATLVDKGPLKMQKPPVGKMIWAFYYLWYRRDDWASPFLKDRPVTPYASNDFGTLTRHIKQAQSVGIDGFVASWWGPSDYTDYNLRMLLDAAEIHGFAITAYFETLKAPGCPRDEKQIIEWLEYLISRYGQHPAYYRLNGKPVIVIWASDAVPLATWHRIFTDLRVRGFDAVYIGMGYNPEILSVFDGLHEYSVAGRYRLGALYQHVAKQVRSYSLLYPESTPKIWVATLQPGYDDRTLPGREGFYWERRDGASYHYTFEAAMKSDPDWLFITTWNEWWEHTYIEPSVKYGDFYLQLTRKFAEMWKGSDDSGPPVLLLKAVKALKRAQGEQNAISIDELARYLYGADGFQERYKAKQILHRLRSGWFYKNLGIDYFVYRKT